MVLGCDDGRSIAEQHNEDGEKMPDISPEAREKPEISVRRRKKLELKLKSSEALFALVVALAAPHNGGVMLETRLDSNSMLFLFA